MDRKIIPETEYRLLILYALTRLGPCTAAQLLQFVVEYDLMNYFTLQLAICEMEEQGLLEQKPHPLGGLLTLTEQGAYTLQVFEHRIPGSTRREIDAQAHEWHARFRLEQEAPAEAVTVTGGKCLHLQLLDGASVLLDVLLRVAADDPATVFLARRWQLACREIYQLVTETLSEGLSAQAPVPELPADVNLRPVGSDWMLGLGCADGSAMTLSLPDELMAHWYAARWPAHGEQLMERILRQLRLSLPDEN